MKTKSEYSKYFTEMRSLYRDILLNLIYGVRRLLYSSINVWKNKAYGHRTPLFYAVHRNEKYSSGLITRYISQSICIGSSHISTTCPWNYS